MKRDVRIGAFFGAPITESKIGRFHLAERLYRPRQAIPQHTHERPYVCYVVSGRYRERDGRRTVECAPSTLLLHPGGAVHSDQFEDDHARLLMVEMDSAWLEGLDAPLLREPAVFPTGPVAAFGARIRREAAWSDDVSPLFLEGLLLELLASAFRERFRGSPRLAPAWVVRTRDLLDASFRRPPSLAKLAVEAAVHPGHLTRSFRRQYGMSIGTYVRALRVKRAKELLPKRPLGDVALECGFADQSHFTRTFHRIEGMTPAEFRRSIAR